MKGDWKKSKLFRGFWGIGLLVTVPGMPTFFTLKFRFGGSAFRELKRILTQSIPIHEVNEVYLN
jgi:hypothetical protein